MALPPIIPPDPIEANVDYRYDGCYQSMVLVLLQRIVDESDDTALIAKVQEIVDQLVTLNGKVATETTLALIEAITAQMNFTGGALDVNATISTAGLSTEAKQDDQIALATAANILLTSLEGKDFATETTLEAVRVLIASLNLQAQGNNVFGDTSVKTTVGLTAVSVVVLAANANRKEAVIYNDTGKRIWLTFGIPAVFGTGIPLEKNQPIISDKYRGVITAIMDAGQTGNIQVTETSV